MKVNSRMTFTTDTVGIFTQMVITIQVIGLMESGLDGGNQLTSQEESMKECGSIANLWDLELTNLIEMMNKLNLIN